jgi:hypothetical protein
LSLLARLICVVGTVFCRIIAKVSLDGHNFLHNMTNEIPIECIPERIGGQLKYYNEAYDFNIAENGPLSYPGCPLRRITEGTPIPNFNVPPPYPPIRNIHGDITRGISLDVSFRQSRSLRKLDVQPSGTSTSAGSTVATTVSAATAPSVVTTSPTPAGKSHLPAVIPPLPSGSRIPDGFPGRWKASEDEGIKKMREILKDEMASVPQYPEVVGDRRVVRFLRARSGNIPDAVNLYRDFLKWYKANNVAEVRNRILYGRCNQPSKFPQAKIVLRLQPQVVISTTALDKKGSPIVVETFHFSPSEVFKNITIEQYLEWLLYTLEFRTLIFEQLSEIRERKYLEEHPDPASRVEGFGETVSMCSIRDMSGLGFAHMGSQSKQMLSAGLKFGIRKCPFGMLLVEVFTDSGYFSANYPEMLSKAHFTNVPMFFNVIWLFIKPFLDAK